MTAAKNTQNTGRPKNQTKHNYPKYKPSLFWDFGMFVCFFVRQLADQALGFTSLSGLALNEVWVRVLNREFDAPAFLINFLYHHRHLVTHFQHRFYAVNAERSDFGHVHHSIGVLI